MTELPIGLPPILPIMLVFTLVTALQFFMFGSDLISEEIGDGITCDITFSFSPSGIFDFASSMFDCTKSLFKFVFALQKTIFNFITFNVPGAPLWLRAGFGLVNFVVIGLIVGGITMLIIRLIGDIIDAVSPF